MFDGELRGYLVVAGPGCGEVCDGADVGGQTSPGGDSPTMIPALARGCLQHVSQLPMACSGPV
jgi:hypothetical protein